MVTAGERRLIYERLAQVGRRVDRRRLVERKRKGGKKIARQVDIND